jgi:hypothetical protein
MKGHVGGLTGFELLKGLRLARPPPWTTTTRQEHACDATVAHSPHSHVSPSHGLRATLGTHGISVISRISDPPPPGGC